MVHWETEFSAGPLVRKQSYSMLTDLKTGALDTLPLVEYQAAKRADLALCNHIHGQLCVALPVN